MLALVGSTAACHVKVPNLNPYCANGDGAKQDDNERPPLRGSSTLHRMSPDTIALVGWRGRKVGYAVRHKRFSRASRPERKRGHLQLLKTEIFDFPRCSRGRGHG